MKRNLRRFLGREKIAKKGPQPLRFVSPLAGDHEELEAAGYEVLHDERADMSPGAKFKDADLLGFPLRVTVGTKGLKDGIVELRDRLKKPIILIPANPPDQMDGMISAVKDGLPTFVMPDNAIRCIGAMVKRAEYLRTRR